MMPLSEWSLKIDPYFESRRVAAFDLDDTLTTHGSLPPEVAVALEKVQKSGWFVFLVTGRPAGWADALIKLLPFDGIVAENGAVLYFWKKTRKQRGLHEEPQRLFWHPGGNYLSTPPEGMRKKHAAATKKILEAFPRVRVASDQPFRLYDLAIDFAEEVEPPLTLAEATGIAKLFEKLGATAKVSSIHVNGWWGQFSKADGLARLLKAYSSLSGCERNLVYVGDSPNDGPLFELTQASIGVANIRAFSGVVKFSGPQYITAKAASEGALEVLAKLTSLRRG
ncbi:MAG: HAD family phosphatase [Bdellovibrionales bacterium]|nr:HAD family phosphatase [Bdellovibrionales bacterium]